MTNPLDAERETPSGTDANIPVELNEPDSSPGRRRSPWLTAAVIVGTVAGVLLVKFAFDVFLIVFLFACLAVVLHAGSQIIAESEFLSPAWIVIALSIIATGVWLFTPSDTLQRALHFERYTPKAVGDFLEWSTERGWAQRALVRPDAGGAAGAGSETPPPYGSFGGAGASSAPPAGGTGLFGRPSGGGIGVSATVSQAAIRAGQSVTITATVMFPRAPDANASTTVRFYDGQLQMGSAPIQLSGTTAVASLTTTALLLGDHTITASYAGPGLFGTVTSSPVTVKVSQ